MKKIVFILCMIYSMQLMAECDDQQVQGGNNVGEGSAMSSDGPATTSQFVTEQAGQALSGCINLPTIKVYGYAPSLGTFGGIRGIIFALSYAGAGGGTYVASTDDNTSCDNIDFMWALEAFRKYRIEYIKQNGGSPFVFIENHPSGTEWSVDLPSGEVATYSIANDAGQATLSLRKCE